jgi:hypothetical protein
MGRSLKNPVYKKPTNRRTKKIVKKKKSKATKKQNNRKHSSKSSSKRRQSRKGTKKKKKTSTTSRGKKRTKKYKGVQEGGYHKTLKEHVKAFKKNLKNFKNEYSKIGFDNIKVSINKYNTGINLTYTYLRANNKLTGLFSYDHINDNFYFKKFGITKIIVGNSIAEIIYYLAFEFVKAEKKKQQQQNLISRPPTPNAGHVAGRVAGRPNLGGRQGNMNNPFAMRNTMALPGMKPETRFNSTIDNSLEAKITEKILTESALDLSDNTSDIKDFYRTCLNVKPLETTVVKKCIILDFDQTITPDKEHGVGSLPLKNDSMEEVSPGFNKTRRLQISEIIQNSIYNDKIEKIDAINKEYNSYTTEKNDELKVLINGHIGNKKYTDYYKNLINFLKECKEDGYDIIIASNNVLSFIKLFLNLLDEVIPDLGFKLVENITIITPYVVNNKFFNNEFFKTNNIRARGCDMMKQLVILTKDGNEISFEDFKAAMYIYIYRYLGYDLSLYIDDTPGNPNMGDIINESENLNSKTFTVTRFGDNEREGGIHTESGDNNEKSTYDEIRELIQIINKSFTETANSNYSKLDSNASPVADPGTAYSALDRAFVARATTSSAGIKFDSREPKELKLLNDYLRNVSNKFIHYTVESLDATSLIEDGAPFENLTDDVKRAYKLYHNDPDALRVILPFIKIIKDYNVTEDTINEIFTDDFHPTPSHEPHGSSRNETSKQQIKRVQEREREIETSPFYHELLNRDDAEILLKSESSPVGSFFIRRSSSQLGYIISVKYKSNNLIKYNFILTHGFNLNSATNSETFRTLNELITYYSNYVINNIINILLIAPALDVLPESDMNLLIKNMKTQGKNHYLPYFYENKTDSNLKYYVGLSANKNQFTLQLPDNNYSISVGTKKKVGNNTYDVGKPLSSEEDINSTTFYFYLVKERPYHSIGELIENEPTIKTKITTQNLTPLNRKPRKGISRGNRKLSVYEGFRGNSLQEASA